jgi:hypothetical protein
VSIISGLVPRKIRIIAEEHKVHVPLSRLLLPEKQKNVRQLFKDYCVSLCKHLVKVKAFLKFKVHQLNYPRLGPF